MNTLNRIFDITGSVSKGNMRTIVQNGLNWRNDSKNLRSDLNNSIRKVKHGK